MFFIIIGVIFLLNPLLFLFFARLNKGSRWKWLPIIFMTAQVGGILVLFLGRKFNWHWELPSFAVNTLLVWNLLGLPLFTVFGLLVAIGLTTGAIRKWVKRRRALPETINEEDDSVLTRRQALGIIAATTPPLFTLSLAAIGQSQIDNFRVRRMTVPIPNLPRDLQGVTIAHVTDMHVGRFTHGKVLKEMSRVTSELKCDLVLCTGDLINDSLDALPEALGALKEMESRYGLWTVEGNHDLIEDGNAFERITKAAGIRLLRNENALIEINGQPVHLLGLPWVQRMKQGYEEKLASAVRELGNQKQADAFPILLSHHPHAFDTAGALNIPITLAGHTHGGQLMLNEQLGCGSAIFRYWSGLYQKDQSRLVVSNGAGNWFPLRINAPAEIVHITLTREGG